MDIRRIRYFLALCDTLNFSSTARTLSISQPALTKAINRLEEDLGGKLIRREGKHTHLTPLGKTMVGSFRELDTAASRAEQVAEQLANGELSRLNIAVLASLAPRRVVEFLKHYKSLHPDICITLKHAHQNTLSELLLSGKVDCALLGKPIPDVQRLKITELYNEPLLAVMPKTYPLAQQASVSLNEVLQQPYIDRIDCEFRSWLLEFAESEQITMDVVVHSSSDTWVEALVGAGVGLTIMPADSITTNGVSSHSINSHDLQRSVSLAVPTGREDNPAMRRFVELIRDHSWH